jgi:hypothetical protein
MIDVKPAGTALDVEIVIPTHNEERVGLPTPPPSPLPGVRPKQGCLRETRDLVRIVAAGALSP